ncbi:hypothetical protein PGKDCPLP_03914 [Stenotrophomonas maltophilia]|nr:hypothetical protein PGKDCPLP_03914 [Stenotrophomonas maltophilia]
MAPSMAPTVLRSPSRTAPDSFLRVPATEENQKIKSKGRRSLLRRAHARLLYAKPLSRAWLGSTEDHSDHSFVHPRMAWIYCVDQGRHLPTAAMICRRRGGSGCGGVSAMDGATEPPWTDLRRPPQPDPPRHPSETCSCCWCCRPAAGTTAGAGRSPASTDPLLLQEVVHQQMLHVVEAAVQHRLGGIQRGTGHLLGLDLRRHHQLGAAGVHIQQRRAPLG